MIEAAQIPDVVPLFPLPEVVLFPRALLPLHIFEPRYRAMVADALASHRTLAIAMLRDGFEPLYYTRHAPVHRIVGVGRIVAEHEVDEGRYNILLQGMARAELRGEQHDRCYRKAVIRPLVGCAASSESRCQTVRRRMRTLITYGRIGELPVRDCWLRMIDCGAGLDELTDVIAAGVPMPAALRQGLLEELDPIRRSTSLLQHLRVAARLNAAMRARHRCVERPGWSVN